MKLTRLSQPDFIAAGLPTDTSRFLASDTHPIPNLDILVQPVDNFFDFDVPDDASNVTGLWTENADPTIMWDRAGKREFVRMYHDDAGFHLVADTLQQLLADVFMRYHELESLDAPDEPEFRRLMCDMGAYIGFRGSNELFDLLTNFTDDTAFDTDLAALLGKLNL